MTQKLIWDLPVRLFHWSLLCSIAYGWFAVEILEDMDHHFIAGYCTLTLILFRIIWGAIGTYYARFGNFLYPPGEIIRYAKTLFSHKNHKKYAGHNPLGGLAVCALLFVILLQASSGLFSNDEYFYFGPLSDNVPEKVSAQIGEFHEFNFNIILGLIVLHIAAILFHRIVKKEKLTSAMITGKKEDASDHYQAITGSKLIAAMLVLIICGSGVYAIANYA